MFEYPPPKRHPFHTFEFWFIVLVGTGLLGAWQLGLIKAPQKTQAELANLATEEPMPPAPVRTVESTEDTHLFSELEPAPLQEETTAGSADTAWPDFQQTVAPEIVTQAAATKADSYPVHDYDWASQANFTAKSQHNDNGPNLIESTTANAVTVNPVPPADETEKLSSFRFASEPAPQTETAETPTKLVALAPTQTETFSKSTPFSPQPKAESGFDFTEVDALIEAGDDITAHRTLSTWFWKNPEQRDELMNRLNMLASRIYFQPQPHYMDAYTVQYGDRLESIAKRYNVSWEYLAKLNRTEPQRIRPDQALKVIQGPFAAVIDLSDFKIIIHAHGYYVTSFDCGIGKDGTTPIGSFKVTDKLEDPTYYGPDGVIKCDDPSNPLGERWIAISDDSGQVQGYGIHGTIDPGSIGKAESRGCIRLNDHDINNVYDLLTVGSEVVIRR